VAGNWSGEQRYTSDLQPLGTLPEGRTVERFGCVPVWNRLGYGTTPLR
jgi:hypothetical protein